MKKLFVLTSMSVMFLSTTLLADGLKNSLTNIMNTDDSVKAVDLSNLNLNAKPKPVKKVHSNRAGDTVIATVNGNNIFKKDADGYLRQRTQGKIDNYDKLPEQQQKMLLQELSLPILALDAAKNELTEIEKQTIFTRAWMQKEARTVDIKEEDIQTVYDTLKQQSIDNNDTRVIPPFDQIKENLRVQMIEKNIMTKLMKDIKIEVAK